MPSRHPHGRMQRQPWYRRRVHRHGEAPTSGGRSAETNGAPPHAAEAGEHAVREATGARLRERTSRSADKTTASPMRGARSVTPFTVTLWQVWLSIIAIPVLLAVQSLELWRELEYRFRRDAAVRRRWSPPFSRSPRMEPPEHCSVADVVEQLARFPFSPLPLPSAVTFYRFYGADGLSMLLQHQHQFSALPHVYPGVFRPRLFDGYGGARLAALQAMHNRPGPALIVVHGLATTKNFDYIRQLAVKAYRQWGFHVVAFDLRGFGQSAWTSDAPASAGWAEGLDVVEIARALHADPRVTSVGAIGYSLGGTTVLNAAHHASYAEDNPLDGGALTVCAPTEMERAVKYASRRPKFHEPFFGLHMLFRLGMRAIVRELGVDPSIRDWEELLEHASIPKYGVSREEFYRRSSAADFGPNIRVPVLAMHARDDFVVPVDHAEALERATAENPDVHVWTLDKGSHCAFSTVDRQWYFSVVHRWFEYWAQETPELEAPID